MMEGLHQKQLLQLPMLSGEEDCQHTDCFIQAARVGLHLQPLDDKAAALWLISALKGQARQTIFDLPIHQIDAPEKILGTIQKNWGEQRDVTGLCTEFFSMQQKNDILGFASQLQYL